ncbi:hypothetical protein HDU83_003349 [Entophlyctis luteolus]|nr:hypothetical protein HDU83_003349 [Entophlyctis luteolus]
MVGYLHAFGYLEHLLESCVHVAAPTKSRFLQVQIKLAINRLKLQQQKKTAYNQSARKEIAMLLEQGKDDSARVRVEHIIREDFNIEAMEIIELYCEMLLARFGLLEQMTTCDKSIEEAVNTIIYAARRMDVKELGQVRDQLAMKFGRDFQEGAEQNANECANSRVVHKLNIKAPDVILVDQYLKAIANAYNVQWEGMIHPSEDLLGGVPTAPSTVTQTDFLYPIGAQLSPQFQQQLPVADNQFQHLPTRNPLTQTLTQSVEPKFSSALLTPTAPAASAAGAPSGSSSNNSSLKRKLKAEPTEADLKRMRGASSGDADDEPGEASGNVDDDDDRFMHGDGLTDKQRDILDIVDAAEDAPAAIDLPTLKKYVLKLEHSINKNEEMRVRYPDDPLKFIDSEADLDENLHNLMSASAVPELYPNLVSLGAVSSLLSLFEHPNVDIALAAVHLLSELTDDDVVAEATEDGARGMKHLVQSLIDQGVLDVLVQTLSRLDEFKEDSDDKQGVFDILSVVENMISVDPAATEPAVAVTRLIPWLLDRIAVKMFDSNRQYASELLAILLQSSPVPAVFAATTSSLSSSTTCRAAFLAHNGVGILLTAIAAYRKRDPRDADEIEMMENLFDSLCAALGDAEVKKRFLEEEGIELMVIALREKKMARMRALKTLTHAMTGPGGEECANRFIDAFGLKSLFPIFMHKGLKSYKKEYKAHLESEEDEHVMSILACLFKHSSPENRLRLCIKFSENDCEKVERLLEMHEQYSAKMRLADAQLEQDRELRKSEEDGDNDDDGIDTEEERYLNRLEKGLFTLQLVDLVAGYLCTMPIETEIRDRVAFLLGRRGDDFSTFTAVLREYAEFTGGQNDETNTERNFIMNVLAKLEILNGISTTDEGTNE